LIFARAGAPRALVIGMASAFRNLGVIMAAIGTSLPDLAWFYFALAQFPIYLMPALLKLLARRLERVKS
jgi:BASS family bile acid:Na+ symporter